MTLLLSGICSWKSLTCRKCHMDERQSMTLGGIDPFCITCNCILFCSSQEALVFTIHNFSYNCCHKLCIKNEWNLGRKSWLWCLLICGNGSFIRQLNKFQLWKITFFICLFFWELFCIEPWNWNPHSSIKVGSLGKSLTPMVGGETKIREKLL